MNAHFPVLALLPLCWLFAAAQRGEPASQEPPAIVGMPDLSALDRYLYAQQEAARIPGLAIVVVQGEEIVYLQGYGEAGPHGRPVTGKTPFIIGSNSKAFTAMAIMQLVEAGKVALSAPVQRYLPWFRLADGGASARITVRHLLHQTSGIPPAAGQQFALDDDHSAAALERHVRGLATVAPSAEPGEVYQYSNANYNVLGLIVQVVSGQSYEAYVESELFAPLAMDRSYTSAASAEGLASGYQYWFGRPRPAELPFNRGDLPSGYLIASAEDMGHMLIAHLNEGRYQGEAVVSPTGMAVLHRPGAEIRPGASYAMGWSVTEVAGSTALLHSGATANYRSHMMLLPEQKLGFAILLNASDGLRAARLDDLRSGVAHLLLGQEAPPAATGLPGTGLTIALPLLFLVELLATVRALRAFRRPEPYRWWLLPLHGLVALSTLLGLPLLAGLPLRILLQMQPDLAWTATGTGLLAALTTLLRTATYREQRQPTPVAQD